MAEKQIKLKIDGIERAQYSENTPPVDNTPFLKAFENLRKNNTDATRRSFIFAFANARFLYPIIMDPAPVDGVVDENVKITYHRFKAENGKQYLLAFTSAEEMKKWDEQDDEKRMLMALNFDTLRNMFKANPDVYDGILIDCKGEAFSASTEFVDGVEKTVHPDMSVKAEKLNTQSATPLKEATEVSQEVKAAVIDYCKANDEIKKAYILQTVRQGEDKPTPVYILDFDDKTHTKTLFDGLAAAIKKALKQGETIGMMPAYDKFASVAVENSTPVYVKE